MTSRAQPGQRLVCLGDSITAGRRQPENRRWTALLQESLEAGDPGIWEVYNRGVPADTVRCGLDRFEKEVAPLLPAWVLIEFGLNDSSIPEGRTIPRVGLHDFETGLREVLRLVTAGGGKPVLLTNHPVDPDLAGPGGPVATLVGPYQETIRRVSSSHPCALLDVEKGFSASGRHLADDGIHLSREGNAEYARVVLRGLAALGVTDRGQNAVGRQ